MENMPLVLFIIAMGFISSAILSCAVQSATRSSVALSLPDGQPKLLILIFVYCMFAGPYLVLSNTLKALTQHGLPYYMLGGGFIISLIWSMCSGVLIVQLLLILGVVAV